ncbi:MAG: T9SS C-terminal target domain-containing protein [Candidatus Zixiibacteriota bacterium]|nr:MAG: T9SS C-terminal target domain-containing protein [candidate division Zixibacteria bacterium]
MKFPICTILAILAAATLLGAESLVLQPGAEGKDTYICDCLPHVNNPNGAVTVLYQGQWGACFDRLLIQWDLSGLPAGATVDSAVMELYFFGMYGSPAGQMSYCRILEDWGETEVTYNTAPDTTQEGKILLDWPAQSFSWFPVDVTAWVQGWHAGTWPNYGIYGMCEGTAATCDAEFYSSDYVLIPANRPKLTVWYHTLGVDPVPAPAPREFALDPVHPNPFNARALLSFRLAAGADVRLSVYDLQGREVACLYQGWLPAGEYRTPFEAAALPSGTYLARMVAGGFEQTRSVVLVK